MKDDSRCYWRESETTFLALQPWPTLEESALDDALETSFAELIGAIRVVRNLTRVVAKCQGNLDEKQAKADLARQWLSGLVRSGWIQSCC